MIIKFSIELFVSMCMIIGKKQLFKAYIYLNFSSFSGIGIGGIGVEHGISAKCGIGMSLVFIVIFN